MKNCFFFRKGSENMIYLLLIAALFVTTGLWLYEIVRVGTKDHLDDMNE